jgi:hypothetical protein
MSSDSKGDGKHMNTNKIHFDEWKENEEISDRYERTFYILRTPIFKCTISKYNDSSLYLPIVRSYAHLDLLILGKPMGDLNEAKKEIVKLIEEFLISISKLVARADSIVIEEE